MSKYWLLVVCCLVCWSALWKCVHSQGAFFPDCSYLFLPLNIFILLGVLWKLNVLILGVYDLKSVAFCTRFQPSLRWKEIWSASLVGRTVNGFGRGMQFWQELFKQNCTILAQVRWLTKVKLRFFHLKWRSSQFTWPAQSSFCAVTPQIGQSFWVTPCGFAELNCLFLQLIFSPASWEAREVRN